MQSTAVVANKKKNTTSYLSYYAHYEDGSASAFYKWNDQCLKDQCEMAETILSTDNVEQYQGKLLFFSIHRYFKSEWQFSC